MMTFLFLFVCNVHASESLQGAKCSVADRFKKSFPRTMTSLASSEAVILFLSVKCSSGAYGTEMMKEMQELCSLVGFFGTIDFVCNLTKFAHGF